MSPALDAQAAQFLSLTKNLNSEEREIIINALKTFERLEEAQPASDSHSGGLSDSAIDEFIESLGVRTFSRQETIKLEMETLMRYFQRRRELLDDAMTAPEVAVLLGTSRQTPHDRIKAGTLLGLLDNGVWRFPIWQFDPEGPSGVIDGLPEVIKKLKISDFAKLNWLTRPNPVLDNLTPIQALRQGQKERVLTEAAGIGGL